MTIEQAEINGESGALIMLGGRVIAAGTFTVVGGRIAAIQVVANPEKLEAIAARRTLPL
jgi:RNA polymerase sigma-70 factor (ECF subfamily)